MGQFNSNTECAAAPETEDGTLVGRNPESKVGFYGTVPIGQPTIAATGATTQQIVDALAAVGLLKKV